MAKPHAAAARAAALREQLEQERDYLREQNIANDGFTVKAGGATVSKVRIDPYLFGVGVGYRF